MYKKLLLASVIMGSSLFGMDFTSPDDLWRAIIANDMGQFLALVSTTVLGEKTGLGKLPLHEAVMHGREQMVDLLLEHGADPNELDGYGDLPLSVAVLFYQKNIAEKLLSAGADVHKKRLQGRTALHVAARGGDKAIVALLLSNGASLDEADDLGKTPYDLASNDEMRALLRENTTS